MTERQMQLSYDSPDGSTVMLVLPADKESTEVEQWFDVDRCQGRNHWGSGGPDDPLKFGGTTPTVLMKSVITVT